MARKLIVLCDGTFNDPSDLTNVFQFKNRLAKTDQVVYYDAGVGITEAGNTKGWLGTKFDQIMGGAFGSGLSNNVQQAYRWVCENYQDGDELCFLGFSRGAFTARSLAGMIRKIGLVRTPIERGTIRVAFDRYRDGHHPNCPETEDFREALNSRRVEELDLKFVGVWDTVGALGVPVVGPRSLIAKRRWGFHDLELSSHVKIARQALAVDEKRSPFLPAPWCAKKEGQSEQDVEQVWFAGCHSDIGGKHGKLTFRWMAEQAHAAGLRFDPPLAEWADPQDPQVLHESLSAGYKLGTGAVLRPVCEPSANGNGPRFYNESISETARHLTNNGKAVPLKDRPNLTDVLNHPPKPFKGPKPKRWGLFLGYYLRQYDGLCAKSEDCCPKLTASRTPAPDEEGD